MKNWGLAENGFSFDNLARRVGQCQRDTQHLSDNSR